MSSGMPELGSKISLISKADIRYEGRLFTVDPQECTIALASVRSFGTEDRETQYPVAPQSQVYDYILFRGSDIKDIRVLNNVPSLPNDPAIMQMSVPPSLGGGAAPPQYAGQFAHPVVGQPQYAQYHPMAGFPGGVHAQLHKTSSMLDLIGGGAAQAASRSATPAAALRKSPTADQGTQVGAGASAGAGREARRGSTGAAGKTQRARPPGAAAPHQQHPHQHQQQQHPHPAPHHQQHQPSHHHQQHQPPHQQPAGPAAAAPHHHQPGPQYAGGYPRGGWRGRARGRGRGFVPRNKNTLKFDNDYDFEQANTEFEELRTQLARTKLDEPPKPEEAPPLAPEADKKDDSGNETGAGEPEPDDDGYTGYDKTKSFFDNISCEAVERSKGRSQRTDWRTERKLNSETFGVASARRGAWRGRATWRHNPHHQQMSYFPHWRALRGARGRPAPPAAAAPRTSQPRSAPPAPQPQPATAAAK